MIQTTRILRLVLTGGGTGGHVYPALATAAALSADPALADRLSWQYLGSRGGMEAGLAANAGLPFVGISAGAIRGRSLPGILSGIARLGAGFVEALLLLGRFRPDAILATGGYVCVPVVFAAWARRVPILVYLPDVEPGLAVRLISHLATRIAVTSIETRRCFGGERSRRGRRVVETGYPVRPEVVGIGRLAAREQLRIPIDERVLLVFGGSRGAQTLNDAVANSLSRLLPLCHIVHVCGVQDEPAADARRASLPANLAGRYHLFGYLQTSEMAVALAAADLAVSRSGASSLGEFPAIGLPSIQVPYPYAGAHQRHNAAWLAANGAAIVLENEAVRAGALGPEVERLFGDPVRLAEMAQATRKLARPRAAELIGQNLRELAEQHVAGARQARDSERGQRQASGPGLGGGSK